MRFRQLLSLSSFGRGGRGGGVFVVVVVLTEVAGTNLLEGSCAALERFLPDRSAALARTAALTQQHATTEQTAQRRRPFTPKQTARASL